MQGIEILNKEPVMIQDERLFITGMICLVIAIVCSIIGENHKDDEVKITFFCGFVVFILTAFGLVLSYKTTTIPSDRYQYEAIMDENVSIQEVYEKYNVIEQDGKKWILEDKECAE